MNSCTWVDINTLVFGDFISDAAGGSDTGGRLFIGGNADLNAYSVGDQLEQSNGDRDDLVVGGTLTYKSGTVSKVHTHTHARARARARADTRTTLIHAHTHTQKVSKSF